MSQTFFTSQNAFFSIAVRGLRKNFMFLVWFQLITTVGFYLFIAVDASSFISCRRSNEDIVSSPDLSLLPEVLGNLECTPKFLL